MKQSILVLMAVLLLVTFAAADTPVVTITNPTATTIYVSSFPATQSVTFTVYHNPLADLHVLNFAIDGVDVLDPTAGDPFPRNACRTNGQLGPLTCSTNGTDTATLTYNWTGITAGNHTLTISVKHRSDEADVTDTITFVLISAEYPAPPSVANGFINADPVLKAASAKKRGCVISKIAAAFNAGWYGDKPGPYNIPAIQGDVYVFMGQCQ